MKDFDENRINADVYLPDNTHFVGDIIVTGNVIAGNHVTIEGSIDTKRNVYFGDNAKVDMVFAGGGDQDIRYYHVSCEGFVHFGKHADIDEIHTEGDVEIGEDSHVIIIDSPYDDIIIDDNSSVGLIRATTREIILGSNVSVRDVQKTSVFF